MSEKPTKPQSEGDHQAPSKPRLIRRFRKPLIIAGAILGLAAAVAAASLGYLYASSPVSIREPLSEHYHFRMQILVNGRPENFGQGGYQEGYSKDNCSAILTKSPIHFHDNQDQFVHIHWEGMTGGQVLKYYGWNFIGGQDDKLGYRFDKGHRLQPVPIHGELLPARPENSRFYVFASSDDGKTYTEKRFDDFVEQDLEVFFNRTSNYPGHKLNQQKRPTSWLERLTPKAQAHSTDSSSPHGDAHDEAELTRINNLLGDVVIFVQQERPQEAQIKDRFGKLTPLTLSSCGG